MKSRGRLAVADGGRGERASGSPGGASAQSCLGLVGTRLRRHPRRGPPAMGDAGSRPSRPKAGSAVAGLAGRPQDPIL